MNYYAYDRWNSPYLDHHGVKGMRWGVRHERISLGRRRGSSKSSTKRRGLSRNAKRALKVGAIAAGAVLVAAGGYYLYRSGKLNKGIAATKDILNRVGATSVVHAEEPVPKTAADISAAINPQERCCNFNSFAAALEGSGNFKVSLKSDASSKYLDNVGDLMNNALKFPDSRINDTIPAKVFKNQERLSNAILKFAHGQEGACGQVAGDLQSGGGHAFNWKIENGEVKFFDTFAKTLSGNGRMVYKPREDASFYCYGRLNGERGKITRLDGLTADDLNLDYLKQIFDIKPR